MASYSRSSSSGDATFHRPSALSRGCATMSSISRAHSPTVSGAPSAPRSPAASGPSAWIRARSDLNPSDGFRTSIIAYPSSPGWLLFSITGGGPGRAGHRGTKNRLGIAPPDQDGRGSLQVRDHRIACRAPGRRGHRGAAGGSGPFLRRDRVRATRPAHRPDQRSDLHEPAGRLRAAGPGWRSGGRPRRVLVPVAGGRRHPVALPERALRARRVPPPGRREAAHARSSSRPPPR